MGGNQIQLFDFPHNQHDNNFRNYEEIPIGDDKLNTVTTLNYGLGAVLTQMYGGEEKIFAFVSRTLSDRENYSVIEKEMLACFWATKRLRSFL